MVGSGVTCSFRCDFAASAVFRLALRMPGGAVDASRGICGAAEASDGLLPTSGASASTEVPAARAPQIYSRRRRAARPLSAQLQNKRFRS